MTEQKQDWFDRWLVPDVLREHPIPNWRKPLPDTGSRLHRIGRLLWRAYRLSHTARGKSDLPGPAYDACVIVTAVMFGVAWLVT